MIHPAIIAFWAYGFLALLIGVWAAVRLDPVAGLLLFGLWLLGIAEELVCAILHSHSGAACTPPVELYLVMDLAAFAWFLARGTAGAFVFALTFSAQVVLHLAGLAGLFDDPLAFWWVHTATAFLQLSVLAGWAIAGSGEAHPSDRIGPTGARSRSASSRN